MDSLCDIYTLGIEAENINNILEEIKSGTFVPGIYVLLLGTGNDKQIVIYPSWVLSVFPQKDAIIVGMSYGKDNAFKIVKAIAQEVYESTGELDIYKYLKTTIN